MFLSKVYEIPSNGQGSVELAFYEPNRTPTVREGILWQAKSCLDIGAL